MNTGVSRQTFTNPTSTDVVLAISGDYVIVENMTNDTAAQRKLIHFNSKGRGGIPLINRMKLRVPAGFSKIIIEATAGGDTGTVHLLVGVSSEIDVTLPDS